MDVFKTLTCRHNLIKNCHKRKVQMDLLELVNDLEIRSRSPKENYLRDMYAKDTFLRNASKIIEKFNNCSTVIPLKIEIVVNLCGNTD